MKATRLSPHAHTLLALVAAYDEAHREAMPLSALQWRSGLDWHDLLPILGDMIDAGAVEWLDGGAGDSVVRLRP